MAGSAALALGGGFANPPANRHQSSGVIYQVDERAGERVHLLTIANDSALMVVPAVGPSLQPLAQIARARGAIAGINGGYFDPANQQTNSWVLINGRVAANPGKNRRLIENPALRPYLNAILARSEFRVYRCRGKVQYGIAAHQAPIPPACRLEQALGGGPQLLPNLTTEREAFTAREQGVVVRDAIDALGANARTAVGIKADGQLLWVMVEQKPGRDRSGMTLAELGRYLQGRGVIAALNLDGGSSSSIYVQGVSHGGQRDRSGQPIQRAIQSVLLLVPGPSGKGPSS
ncbi:phosphodiester glycosidase family protein [Cyanobium sp. ATX 6F1]|uniref:phosphodiester glycosidase family protein n=1 Tax=unclassified Cyanobium TaxID=2627006 RepID=UPI0020CBF3BF|nr:phosphodiester glycosidase family protein [Cyanobium sp. ATX 6F1]MCP9916264.1 phosphodiester glycosidase family protein [Cyanobium sp. ATX 6F1]